MTPDGTQELPRKRYYDVFSWFITQLAFSFTVAPFILLSLHDSVLVWARVYFYCTIGVTATSLFLASPGKKWLQSQVKQYSRPTMARTESYEGDHPTLGLPNDPGKEWDEMIEEISAEIDARRKRGIPLTDELKQTAAKLSKIAPNSKLAEKIR